MRRLLLALAVVLAPAGARAAVTYVGVGSTAPVISTTTCTPTTASVTRQAGDLLIVLAHGEGADGGAAPLSLSTANGFTAVPNASAYWDDGDAIDETGETAINAWYLIATGASDAMPVVADSGDHTSCLLVVFRGVDQTTPIACSASDGTDASDTTGSFPTCTTGVDGGGMVLMAESVTDDAADTSNGATYANANLTTITEREDETSATGLGGGLLVVTANFTTSGALGATTYTKDNARRSAYLTIAMKRAVQTTSDSYTEAVTAADSLTSSQGEPTIDAGFPVTTFKNNSTGATITSPSFTVGGSDRTLVLVYTDYSTGADIWPISCAWDGGTPGPATAWALRVWNAIDNGTSDNPNTTTSFTGDSTSGVDAEDTFNRHHATRIWTSTWSGTPASASVTCTRTGTDANTGIVSVYSLAGAQTTFGAKAQHHSSGTEIQNLTAQTMEMPITASASKSLIIGGLYWGNATGAVTANGSTTIDFQNNDGGAQGVGVAFRYSGITTASTAYTLGITSSQWAWGIVAIEVLAAASGPQTYTDSFTEAVTAADSLAQTATLPQAYSEAATAGDSLAAGMVYVEALSEAATAGDSLASATTFAVAYSEAANSSDSLAQACVMSQALSEAAAPADSLAAGAVLPVAFTEAAALGDQQLVAVTYAQSLTEAASPADALAQVATMPEGLSETVTSADSLAVAALRPVAFSEAAAAADSLADNLVPGGGATYSDSFTEAASAGDSLASSSTLVEAFSEAAGPGDALAQVCTMPQATTEAAIAGDGLAVGALLPEALAEAVTTGDQLGVAATFPSAYSEAAAAGDALASSATLVASLTEAATPGDSLVDQLNGGASQYQDAFTEAVSAGGSLAHAAVMPEVLAEGATAGDALAAGAVYPVAVSEPATAGDSLAAGRVMPEAVTEVASPGDSLLSTATLTAAFTEAVAALDSWVASGGTAFGLDQAPRLLLRLARPALYLYLPRPVLELDVARPSLPLTLPR